ncbi:MAG: Fe-S protein assembly co-chaperone HscB [Myxococcales bacterium]|nr:Fe-S protein assembly co-chaperone HscB [Myxococcales bacterium]
MNDPFETLGLARTFEIDLRAVEQRFRDLSRAVHPDRFADKSPAERRMAAEQTVALNDAFRLIRDSMNRVLALLAAAGKPIHETARAEPSLLMEIMELREAIDDARNDGRSTEALVTRVGARIADEEASLKDAFDGKRFPPERDMLERAYEAGVRLKYLYRLRDELDALD